MVLSLPEEHDDLLSLLGVKHQVVVGTPPGNTESSYQATEGTIDQITVVNSYDHLHNGSLLSEVLPPYLNASNSIL